MVPRVVESDVLAKIPLVKNALVPTLVGLSTGFLAGLVGLGGAELRMPFLLYTISLPLRLMIAVNLIVSLIVSGSSFLARLQSGLLPVGYFIPSLGMIIGSLGGGFLGSIISHKVSTRKLKLFLAMILSVVIVRLFIDIYIELTPTRFFSNTVEFPSAILFGFVIGLIAGVAGVAGGEYRIPGLVLLFGLPLKTAGTISQLVSVPTVLASMVKHNQYNTIGRRSMLVAVTMGAGSVLGVVLSTYALFRVPDSLIRIVFIGILSYSVIRLLRD